MMDSRIVVLAKRRPFEFLDEAMSGVVPTGTYGASVSYGAPTTSYAAPMSYGAAMPTYGASMPTYGASMPTYGASMPSFGGVGLGGFGGAGLGSFGGVGLGGFGSYGGMGPRTEFFLNIQRAALPPC